MADSQTEKTEAARVQQSTTSVMEIKPNQALISVALLVFYTSHGCTKIRVF